MSQNHAKKSVEERRQQRARINLLSELVDLTSIVSVQQLSQRLLASISRIDVIVLNAGIGGWIGLNWLDAVWTVTTDWVHAVTWPTFKKSGKGWTTNPQISDRTTAADPSDGTKQEGTIQAGTAMPLGEVFAANVFGHYLLVHYIMPLLSNTKVDGSGGKIIWVSSLEAHARALYLEDLQALESYEAYESSKRLTDVLSLTYSMPATKPWVSRFLGDSKGNTGEASSSQPRMYVTQPGVSSTGIFPLPFFIVFFVNFAFYVARWLGSPWHTIDPYISATSVVWIALASQAHLDSVEEREGQGKWGSATDRLGRERVLRTEVEGWGWGGVVGESTRKGRKRGAQDLTREQREGFVELGRQTWKALEDLRGEWEARLPPAQYGLRS